jgi:hypothetical protein
LSDTISVQIGVSDELVSWGLERERKWEIPWASELVAAWEALEAGFSATLAGSKLPNASPPLAAGEQSAEGGVPGALPEPAGRRVVLTLVGDAQAVRASERLLARLEALVYEAVRAKRVDLLVGLDLWTAEALRLRYHFGAITVGSGDDVTFTYAEALAILRAGMSWTEIQTVMELRQHFAEASGTTTRFDGGGPPRPCDRCGTTEAVCGVEFEDGSRYCGKCYGEVEAKLAPRRREAKVAGRGAEQLKL